MGDGTGGKVSLTVTGGKITSATVTAGGTGYTYGMVDLGGLQQGTPSTFANLIPIIPPSRGHGYNIYKELGADRVLVYARFDDSTKDFPTDTKFAQVGILKNPSTYTSENTIFTSDKYSSLGAIKFNATDTALWPSEPTIGTKITQVRSSDNLTAKGYVASYDKETSVLKYYQDRSLYDNQSYSNNQDYIGISSDAQVLDFQGNNSIKFVSGADDTSPAIAFTGRTVTDGNKEIDLGVYFTGGFADPEINKTTGDVIYIDNRKVVSRDSRQKEDIKIILEF